MCSSGLSPGLINIAAVGSVPSGVGARWGSVFPAAADSLAEAFVTRLQVRMERKGCHLPACDEAVHVMRLIHRTELSMHLPRNKCGCDSLMVRMQTPISVAPYGAGVNRNISVSNFTASGPVAAPAAPSAARGPASNSGASAAGAAPAGLMPASAGGPHAPRLTCSTIVS